MGLLQAGSRLGAWVGSPATVNCGEIDHIYGRRKSGSRARGAQCIDIDPKTCNTAGITKQNSVSRVKTRMIY